MKLLIAMLLLVSTSAFASGKVNWSACKHDMEKLKCHGTDKEVDACLEGHAKDLEPKCKELADKEAHAK